jgi:hypothetical protein
MIKKLIAAAVLLFAGGLLFATNPDEGDFGEYIRETAEAEVGGEGGTSETIGDILGHVAGITAGWTVQRTNYFLFSTFTFESDDPDRDPPTYFGIAGMIFEL